MKDDKLLELGKLKSGYGKMVVLHDVSLTVEESKIVTILGSNGVGKTTTLRTILGQLTPMSGEIFYKGKDITNLPPHKTAELGLSYCPEGRNLFGNLTVFENLRAGGYLLKTRKEFKDSLERVYSLFPRLKERHSQLAESLSGGEQQMLAMARALMGTPDLMLLDEPSLGLAPKLVELVLGTLREINETGVSILLVEQNAKLALEVSKYGYVMEKGTIAMEGNAKDLRSDEKVQKVYLGVA